MWRAVDDWIHLLSSFIEISRCWYVRLHNDICQTWFTWQCIGRILIRTSWLLTFKRWGEKFLTRTNGSGREVRTIAVSVRIMIGSHFQTITLIKAKKTSTIVMRSSPSAAYLGQLVESSLCRLNIADIRRERTVLCWKKFVLVIDIQLSLRMLSWGCRSIRKLIDWKRRQLAFRRSHFDSSVVVGTSNETCWKQFGSILIEDCRWMISMIGNGLLIGCWVVSPI